MFFINTDTGRVATLGQLVEAGLAVSPLPGAPWHRIQGSSDASTLWYAVLRKLVTRKSGRSNAPAQPGQDSSDGVYIGALAIRHQPHHASLLADGWEEIGIDEIGVADVDGRSIGGGRGDQAM